MQGGGGGIEWERILALRKRKRMRISWLRTGLKIQQDEILMTLPIVRWTVKLFQTS
jgi:hypothetical protein